MSGVEILIVAALVFCFIGMRFMSASVQDARLDIAKLELDVQCNTVALTELLLRYKELAIAENHKAAPRRGKK